MNFAFAPNLSFSIRWLLAGVMALFGMAAQAADVSVRSTLSRSTTVIGEPVQLQIKVAGARRSLQPPEVSAEGLSIRYLGPSENAVMRFNNGTFVSERSVTFVYQVSADKNGTFKIPSVAVNVDGQSYQTEPVGLNVQSNSADGGGAGQPQATGFAEIVVPKKSVYIGETIPVEVHLLVDARVRWEAVAAPEITGEGFTTQKIPDSQRVQMERGGRTFDDQVFKTSITPSRAGKITLGANDLLYNARIPRARKGGGGGPRSLLDMFDDDIFGDPMFSSIQQLKAKVPPVELTVKPLPVAGKPPSFSGAVGTFQFSAEGAPRQVKIGDPVTMKLRVSGKGNFDRLTAPVLQDATGWRTYPPSSSFKAGDDINYTGTKTFEMAVVPETKKSAMPVFEFSYFDPIAEKYVTLKSEAGALEVQGDPAPVATPAPSAGADRPASTPPPAPQRPNDILGLRYDTDPRSDGTPLYARREYWIAQGGLGLVFLAFLGLKLRRAPDAAMRRAADLRREKAAAWTRLGDAKLGQAEFLETAARIAQLETALATGRIAGSIDAATVRSSGSLSEESQAVIDELFSARAELLYAGEGRGETALSERKRDRVTEALRELEKSHGRS